MNSKQRDYIEADLERLIGKDKLLRVAYEVNQRSDDPLFVKNLENVQGDERDVIFISFTYGPQEKGAANIPQRFGPINSASGWRRLNVLFTRAKKRIQIYSSMTADQIVLNENSSLGVTSL
ncbi:AAA domain-containing protein, partial [Vibrio parahaemolyticus]|uniref:AAA domain-containing protein n=1 Tax=Vibrio parahaemolyticus TaxID=670 RepID=UPI001EE9CE83